MTARNDLRNILIEDARYSAPDIWLDAFAAEVRAAALSDAANKMDALCEQYGVFGVGDQLRKLVAAEPVDPWQAIADALNAAPGGILGIDLDGTITDHDEHSVVWDREAQRWVVAAYDEDDEQPTAEPRTPAVGGRYVSRTDPGRIVTVRRVWTDDDGPAVAFEWGDRGQCGSACPVDVFHREYEPVGGAR